MVNMNNKGFILITVMLLLSILSLLAYVAIEQSQFSFKMNNARVSDMKARQISEDARLIALNQLKSTLANDELELDGSFKNNKALDRYKKDGLERFLSLKKGGMGEAGSAVVYLNVLPTQLNKQGMSQNQNMAYSGIGMGLGNHGSFALRYEMRAKGIVHNKAQEHVFWTASDIQLIP